MYLYSTLILNQNRTKSEPDVFNFKIIPNTKYEDKIDYFVFNIHLKLT